MGLLPGIGLNFALWIVNVPFQCPQKLIYVGFDRSYLFLAFPLREYLCHGRMNECLIMCVCEDPPSPVYLLCVSPQCGVVKVLSVCPYKLKDL